MDNGACSKTGPITYSFYIRTRRIMLFLTNLNYGSITPSMSGSIITMCFIVIILKYL